MPLIKRREAVEKTNISVSMDQKLIDQLNAYADFTNVGRSEIVEIAVRAAIEGDREFLQLQSNNAVINKTAAAKPKAVEKAA